jgi:ATP-dependent Clp endopeptidase proteolytic subunit ClpP
MKKDRYIAIRNQADSDTLELYFLDVIQDNYDWYTGSSSKVQEIIDKVNYYKPSKIKVIIDSEGGDASTGIAIYNFLKRCDAKVEVEILGLAASIASVIAMAANKGKLRIARNAFIMIHKAEGASWGTSEEMRRYADLVDLYTSQIVDIYSQRTGKPVEEINTLIESGDYWMAGEEAVAQGFADETFNDTPNLQIAARLDPSKYTNIPAQIRAQMKPSSEETEETVTKSFFKIN